MSGNIPVSKNESRPGAPARYGSAFEALQHEIDRVFDGFARSFWHTGRTDIVPSTDITETDSEVEITCELPGLEEKDVSITLSDDVLTIKGEKKVEKEEKDKTYHLVERSYGAFSRALALPAGVDPESVKASMAKGVLKVSFPKPKSAAAKKIDIKPGA